MPAGDLPKDDWCAIFDALDHAIEAMGDTLGDKYECAYYAPTDLENMRLRQKDWMRLLDVVSTLTRNEVECVGDE